MVSCSVQSSSSDSRTTTSRFCSVCRTREVAGSDSISTFDVWVAKDGSMGVLELSFHCFVHACNYWEHYCPQQSSACGRFLHIWTAKVSWKGTCIFPGPVGYQHNCITDSGSPKGICHAFLHFIDCRQLLADAHAPAQDYFCSDWSSRLKTR